MRSPSPIHLAAAHYVVTMDALRGRVLLTRQRVLPPGYFGMAVLAMLLLRVTVPTVRIAALPYALLGVIPVMIGLTLNLLADRAFRAHGTTVKPFERSSRLLTGGVFALSRNPMYLGMVLILAGFGVLLRTLAPLLVVPRLCDPARSPLYQTRGTDAG